MHRLNEFCLVLVDVMTGNSSYVQVGLSTLKQCRAALRDLDEQNRLRHPCEDPPLDDNLIFQKEWKVAKARTLGKGER
jgi:hypothetical protein